MACAGFASAFAGASDEMVTPRRAAFLDRDGVLIHTNVVDGKAYAIRSLEEFRLLPGVSEAVHALKNEGYITVVVTNQPDIDNGLVSASTVDEMHQKLRQLLPVDAIYCCPHNSQRQCDCRKPLPGMLYQARDELNIDLSASWMIGDRAGDITAGKTAGCRTIFVDCGYKELHPRDQDATVRSLSEAVSLILKKEEQI